MMPLTAGFLPLAGKGEAAIGSKQPCREKKDPQPEEEAFAALLSQMFIKLELAPPLSVLPEMTTQAEDSPLTELHQLQDFPKYHRLMPLIVKDGNGSSMELTGLSREMLEEQPLTSEMPREDAPETLKIPLNRPLESPRTQAADNGMKQVHAQQDLPVREQDTAGLVPPADGSPPIEPLMTPQREGQPDLMPIHREIPVPDVSTEDSNKQNILREALYSPGNMQTQPETLGSVAAVVLPGEGMEPAAPDFAAQLAEKTTLLSKGEKTELTIALKPSTLGKISISLTMSQGQTAARILTDTLMARELIQGQVTQLKEHLLDRGFEVHDVEVLYTGEMPDGQGQAPSQSPWQQQERQSYESGYRPGSAPAKEREASETPMPIPVGTIDYLI